MAIIQFRSPVTVPLLSADEPSPPAGIFQVTQHFDTPDYYASQRIPPPNPLPTHGAVDIGDKRCGAPIVAMADGVARRVQDNATALGAATNALGILLDHGFGVRTAYWHLASWTAENGAWVKAGQEVGKLGNTGLLAICHCHIELSVYGVKIDPEPYMFGAAFDTSAPTPSEDDNPMYNPKDVLAIYGLQLVTKQGTNLREKQGTSYPILHTFGAGVQLTATARVVGEKPNGYDSIEWYETKAEIAGVIRNGYVYSQSVDVVPVVPPLGFTQAQIDAARTEGVSIGFSRGKTKAIGAVEAIEP